MPIQVSGFPTSQRTPKIYLAVVLGGSGASAASAPQKILLFANIIESDITGAGPSFTITKGNATLATPVQLFGTDDAIARGGRGSEAHLGAAAVFRQYPTANLYLVPVASTGTRATATVTVTNSATAAGTVVVYINGRPSAVANVSSGDTQNTIASAIATAILQNPDLPVTAQVAVNVVTVSAKNTGLRGNQIAIRVVLQTGTSTLVCNAGALSQTLFGTTVALGGGTAVGNVYKLSGATGQDDITNALAAVVSQRYHRQVLAQIDQTNINRLRDQLNTMQAVTTQILQQGICASVDTYANSVTLATAVNSPRIQIGWHYNADALPVEIAAQLATARLYGDAVTGGQTVGESSDPAANLNGLQLASILEQIAPADRPTATQIENALLNGLTVIEPSPANPGYTRVVASITSRFLDAQSQPNYSIWKTKVVTVADYVADDLRSDLANAYAGFKLSADLPGNPPPKQSKVTTPKIVRGRIFGKLKAYEEAAILTNVDGLEPLLQVTQDAANKGRLLAEIPESEIPDFDQLAGNVRQVA